MGIEAGVRDWEVMNVGYVVAEKIEDEKGRLIVNDAEAQRIGQSVLKWFDTLGVIANENVTIGLRLGRYSIEIAKWFLQTECIEGYACMPRLEFRPNDVSRVVFSVYRGCVTVNPRGFEFDLADTMGMLKKFVYLEALESSRSGFGEKTLQEFCSQFNEYSIKGCAGFIFGGDYEHAQQDLEWGDKFLERLVKLYERNGFINMNSISGFEDKVSLLKLGTLDQRDGNRIEGRVWEDIERLVLEAGKTKEMSGF